MYNIIILKQLSAEPCTFRGFSSPQCPAPAVQCGKTLTLHWKLLELETPSGSTVRRHGGGPAAPASALLLPPNTASPPGTSHWNTEVKDICFKQRKAPDGGLDSHVKL